MAALASYQDQVVGTTTAPIDALKAFTEETNAANLQADAAVFELAKNGITDVDVHLSGAMTNKESLDGDGRQPGDPQGLRHVRRDAL